MARRAAALMAGGLLCLLVACGGGGNGQESATALAKPLSAKNSAEAVAPLASVVALTKVSESRVSRTVYDYVFKVTVQNGGLDQLGVVASLTQAGTGTTIIDGNVVVGDMAANAAGTPNDTITLRQDRNFAFDQLALKWAVTSTASSGTLAELNLASVTFGASSDGNVYGIAGLDINKPVILGNSTGDQYILSSSCGSPNLTTTQVGGEWRLMLPGSSFPSDTQIDACLRIINSTTKKFLILPFKMISASPTASTTATLPPQGAATLNTSDGYPVKLSGNTLVSPVKATLSESMSADGSRLFAITFDTNVANAGITVQLPKINEAGNQTRSKTSAMILATPPTSANFAEPYPTDNDQMGPEWNPISAYTSDSGLRIPEKISSGFAISEIVIPPITGNANSTPQIVAKYKLEKVSSLYSVLPRQPRTLNGAEVVVFVHGFSLGSGLGGGKSTWGELPRLIQNPAWFGGKQLIPFEFRWATNGRYADAAEDLGKGLVLINNTLKPEKIHLVAHSFGGILVRTLLQGLAINGTGTGASTELNDTLTHVKSVLTLGTPHSGIQGYGDPNGLPNGQDSLLINACKQASCYEAGLDLPFVLSTAEKNLLYSAGEQSSGKSAPGYLIWQLADFSSLLPQLDFHVGIGLRANSKAPTFLWPIDAGDSLISYEGQRFSPTLRQTKLLDGSAQGRASVRESILGYRQFKGPSIPPASLSGYISFPDDKSGRRTRGFAHAYPVGLLSVLLPTRNSYATSVVSDGDVMGWGLEAAVRGGCTKEDEINCDHASFMLLREMLTAPVPVIDSLSPTSLVGNNTLQPLSIKGIQFLSNNIVQYKGQVATNGAWMIAPLHGAPPVITPNQITLQMLPQLGETSIDFRVCRLNIPQIVDTDCSAAQTLAITAPPAPLQVFRDDFNGSLLNSSKWNISGGSVSVGNGHANFSSGGQIDTAGKVSMGGGSSIVVELRMSSSGSTPAAGCMLLEAGAPNNRITIEDTGYRNYGLSSHGEGIFASTQLNLGGNQFGEYEYRLTIKDDLVTLERGLTLANITTSGSYRIGTSIGGRSFNLYCGTGMVSAGGTMDWVQVTAPTVSVASAVQFEDQFDAPSLDMGKWFVDTVAAACCGAGNPATYSTSSGYLNVNVPGGSCGYCGKADGSVFRPNIPPLRGDFEMIISGDEIERKSRDNSLASGNLQLVLSAGNAQLGIYILGDSDNSAAPQHYLTMYSLANGAIDYLSTRNLTFGKYYAFQFRVRSTDGQLYLAHRVDQEANWTEVAVRQALPANSEFTPRIWFATGDGGFTMVNSSFKARLDFVSIH